MFRMPLIALLTLSVLPAAAQQSDHQDRTKAREQSAQADSTKCQGTRHVVLEPGLSIDVACGSTANIPSTKDQVEIGQEYTPGAILPNPDVKIYSRTTYNIGAYQDVLSAYVFVYKPDGDWSIPPASLNIVGAGIISIGDPLTVGDGPGWVVKQDRRLNQQGKDWLPARQIIEEKSDKSLWVSFRIILDTLHNKFYYLYQRTQGDCSKTEDCGSDQANSFFNSFTVDSGSRP